MKRRVPYTQDPRQLFAAWRGTSYHAKLEEAAHPDCIAEARYFMDLDGMEVSCSPDLVDPVNGVLLDYKWAKGPKWGGPWNNHIEQLQFNRYIVDKAHTMVTAEGEMVEPVRPMDWQELSIIYFEDDGPRTVPVTKSIEVPTVKGDGFKKAKVVDVWDDAVVHEVMYWRARDFKASWDEDRLPPIPNDHAEWAHPLCNYCPVRSICIREEVERVGGDTEALFGA